MTKEKETKPTKESLKIKDLPKTDKELAEEDLKAVAGGGGCSGMEQDPKTSARSKL